MTLATWKGSKIKLIIFAHSIHIGKVAWTHSASLLAGRAERFPSKLPGPGQRLHLTAKPQLMSNCAGVLPLILAAVQYQYILTEKKTQLSRELTPDLMNEITLLGVGPKLEELIIIHIETIITQCVIRLQ